MNKGKENYFSKDFWKVESQKYQQPHLRLIKFARIINSLAGNEECDLLDIGCGPATLQNLLPDNIHYYGIDIAINPAKPNLLELDLTNNPIRFGDKKFDMVIAGGVFEYLGSSQKEKMSEIHNILKDKGKFIASYTNFGHIHALKYDKYNNMVPLNEFRRDLEQFFTVISSFPVYHNWQGTVPNKRWSIWLQKYISLNIPYFSPRFAISYFFINSLKP